MSEFRWWIDHGYCEYAREGYDPFVKVLEGGIFKSCLDIWLSTDTIGRTFKDDIRLNLEDNRLVGYKFRATVVPLNGLSKEGIPYLDDAERIVETYGLYDSYQWYMRNMEIEQYRVFLTE